MGLVHIAGSTYYVDSPSITGVYVFPDRSCLLVDTGSGNEYATLTLELLRENGLTVHGIFNTHAHPDHCGGNRIIQEQSSCPTYTSPLEAAFIQHPILVPYSFYSALPPRTLINNRYLMAPPSCVTDTVEMGRININSVSFQIIDLGGHTLGQVGIVTPDGVAFLGDSLIDPSIMKQFRFHYLADVRRELETLDFLENANFNYAILSHGGLVGDLAVTVTRNRELFQRIMDFVLTVAHCSRSREEIVARVVERFDLPLNRTQYYLILATVSAFLSYLCNCGYLREFIENGVLKFQTSSASINKVREKN